MIASECCGSCGHWRCAYTAYCNKEELHTVRDDTCKKNYKPRNPIKSKHEKMWDDLYSWSQEHDSCLFDLLKEVEDKHNAKTS